MIKIFLHISFGVLDRFYSGEDGKPFKDIVQGNRVVPLLQLIISIFLVRYPYSKSIVIQLVTPVSNVLVLIVALTYLDNTDLYMFNEGDDSIEALVAKVQLLLNTWYEVLKITSRELKLSKCYQILQDHKQKNSKCSPISETTASLTIKTEEVRSKLVHLKATQIRALVGVLINPSYQLAQIEQ